MPTGFQRSTYGVSPTPGSDNLLVDPTAQDVNAVAISAVVGRPSSGSASRQASYNVSITFTRTGTVSTGAVFGVNAYAFGIITSTAYDISSSSVAVGATASGFAPETVDGVATTEYTKYGRAEVPVDNSTSSYTLTGQISLRAIAFAFPGTPPPPPGTVI